MSRVGGYVTDPAGGEYCWIVLDSGEKIILSYDKGKGLGGRLTIEASKLMGFSSDRIYTCDRDSPEGRAIVARLWRGVSPGSLDISPLDALIEFIEDSPSIADIRAKCATFQVDQ